MNARPLCTAWFAVLLGVSQALVSAESPPVGVIDVFGLHRVTERQVRRALAGC
jgi:hypothetical protein